MAENDKALQYPDSARKSLMRDDLGPNSEIGSKLRALYSSIQDETIPDRFLDLLEKLDRVERNSAVAPRN